MASSLPMTAPCARVSAPRAPMTSLIVHALLLGFCPLPVPPPCFPPLSGSTCTLRGRDGNAELRKEKEEEEQEEEREENER
eukprot:1052236-Pyramimonas_sp.AAC.1